MWMSCYIKEEEVENVSSGAAQVLQLFFSMSTNDRWHSHAQHSSQAIPSLTAATPSFSLPPKKAHWNKCDQERGYRGSTLESAVILFYEQIIHKLWYFLISNQVFAPYLTVERHAAHFLRTPDAGTCVLSISHIRVVKWGRTEVLNKMQSQAKCKAHCRTDFLF